jgi:hypothetical protein
MATLAWVLMVAMVVSSLPVIALTIADVFESHKGSQSDKPSADNAKAGNLSWRTIEVRPGGAEGEGSVAIRG